MTPHTDAVILVGGRGRRLQPLTLTPPTMLSPTGVPLPARATLVGGSMLFNGRKVARSAAVRCSVVDSHASVGDGTVLHDAGVGDRTVVGRRVELRAGASAWPNVVIEPGAVRRSEDL
jgi:NDP-sugar pyrophosphorylase family protein